MESAGVVADPAEPALEIGGVDGGALSRRVLACPTIKSRIRSVSYFVRLTEPGRAASFLRCYREERATSGEHEIDFARQHASG